MCRGIRLSTSSCKNNDLDKQLDGNVLRIATKDTLRKEAEENRDLAKAQAEAADVVTTTRVLSYAKAADMATTLKKFLSSRGDILADDRSNTLIIRDIPSAFAGDGQPDPAARPEIAASGNRSARRGCQPHLLARNRHRNWRSRREQQRQQHRGGGTAALAPARLSATSRRFRRRRSSLARGGSARHERLACL